MADIKVEDLEIPSNTVEAVPAGSAAERIGLKAGDQIVAINGQSVTPDQIPERIVQSKGAAVTLTVSRAGNSLDLGPANPEAEGGMHRLGFTLAGAGRLSDADLDQVTGGAVPLSSAQRLQLDPTSNLSRRLKDGLISPIAGVRA